MQIAAACKCFLRPALHLSQTANVVGHIMDGIASLHRRKDVGMMAIALQGISSISGCKADINSVE